MVDKKKRKLLGAVICLIVVFLILFFLFDEGIFLFLIFLTLWIFFIAVTIKPLNRVYYWLIFGKEPTEKQLKIFIISGFVITVVGFLLLLVCIRYPTTPLGYFLRTVIFGFLLIGIYAIYKRKKKK
ncbi:MAG TPA: hypothetical protein ENI34_02925 [candidate division WOR-3 bacterium]|uniref:Uncharacterized protein n=1 Tax=candidate division WOR-3 bacterium TaxID=2052148 RepID=A0A9C9EL49_UNCW3|nr:hypothetical protein [candidate division WOR-3 bacterium]